MRLAELTINKTIYAEEFYAPHGNVSFIFLISGTDIAGENTIMRDRLHLRKNILLSIQRKTER